MKYLPGLYDLFISPITGKLRSFAQIPSFDSPNYIIIGDAQGDPIQSPALIDVRLDIIELRTILDKLVQLGFVIEGPDILLPNAQALNQLINGFLYNTNGVLSIQTPGEGSIALPYGQVLVGDEDNLAQATQLLNKQLLIGNSSDRAEATTVLFLENMPNLTSTKIWRGNTLNRLEESDALTAIENELPGILSQLSDLASIVSAISSTVDALSSAVDAIETGLASIGGFAAIILLQLQVLGLLGAVSGLDSRLSTAEEEIDTIQGQITDIYNRLTDINTRIDNLSASFVGDVQGSGLLSSPISLELMLTLDEVKKAEDTVDLNNNKIVNLVSDDVEQLDALNAKFLWDLMHDNVGVVWA